MTDSRLFIDTNVFAYALDRSEQEERTTALHVIDERRDRIVVSTQVLAELHTRKLGMARVDARHAVEALTGFPAVDTDRGLILRALTLAETAGLSIFDAAIVCAAQRADCAVLLSEDLNPGQDIDSLVVENPFAR